jgi:hypothetical protein
MTLLTNEVNRFGQIFPIRMRRKYRAIQKLCEIKNIKGYGQTNKTYFEFLFKYAPNMLQPNGIRFHCHDSLDRMTLGSHGTRI